MKYVRDEANNLYEALDAAETVAQITSAVNVEKARAMDAEAEEAALIANKVDKVAGKDLSTNDFTDHYKEVLETLETGAVTGVKGDKESVYKTGQVNLTPEHLGASEAKDTHTNLLNLTAKGQTVNGITVTNNGDGSYKLSGTCTAFVDIRLSPWGISNYDKCLVLPKGKYKLVGTPDISSTIHAHVGLVGNDGTNRTFQIFDEGNGTILNHTNEVLRYEVKISVNEGAVLNHTFKPMLTRDLNATIDDFVSFSGDGEINENVAEMYKDLKAVANLIYPVGSIYMSVNAVNPSTLFGGTWEQIKDKFLLSAGDTYNNGATGGEASHTLTTAELPAHAHGLNDHTHSIPKLSMNTTGNHGHFVAKVGTSENPAAEVGFNNPNYSIATNSGANWGYVLKNTNSAGAWTGYSSTTGDHTHTTNASTTGQASGNTTNTGSGTAHNNMPPYLAVNVWKRTA